MAEPWVDWSWLKVGPVLTNEKERAEYEAQKKEREKPQQGPTMDDYRRQQAMMAQAQNPAAVNAIPYTIDSPQGAADRANSGVLTNTPPSQELPAKFDDWSWGQYLNQLYGGNFDTIDKARGGGSDENTPAQTVLPDTPDQLPPPMIPPARKGQEEEGIPLPPEVPGDQSAITPEDPIEAIRKQKQMVDAIYPRLPPQDIGMGDTMEQDEKQLDRSKYLAQLALFSGITQGAGGQWEGVGKGLAGAGAAYSAGYDRYQKAVQSRSDRLQKRVNDKYADDSNRAQAAIGLYSEEKKNEKGQLSEARQRLKDRQTDIDEYFKQRLMLAKGNDMTPQDPAAIDQILRDWRISREKGDVVSTKDVSDK